MTLLRGVYLLYGREVFLKREFIRDFSSQFFPGSESARLNTRQFHADEDSVATFLEYIQTGSFFEDKKLAIFWQVDELEEEDRRALISAFSNLPETCAVILESSQTSLKKDPFLSTASKSIKTIACHMPFEADLPRWVRSQAAKFKKEISNPCCQMLLDLCARDLGHLNAALEQLAIYIADRTTIEQGDIDALLGRSAQTDAFQLVDMILNGQSKQALYLVRDMLKSGKRGLEIAGVLEAQWEKLRKAVFLLQSGSSADEVAAAIKLHPFFREKFMRQAQKVSHFPMERVFRDLLTCDQSIKKGLLSERLALERLVLGQIILTS